MVDDLIEGWKEFNLTEVEDDEIKLDEFLDEELETQVGLVFLGKLFTQNSFNIEAMMSALKASEMVIDQGPWGFDNHLLLLREISCREQLRTFDTMACSRTRLLAEAIGRKLGKFLDFDESDLSGWSKCMRIRVVMDVNKPIPRGSTMKLEGENIWVDFMIERLPEFCYACGCLGHNMRECNDYDGRSA
ncbi:28S ribosomal protein S24 mitochondrial [Bienertia sinuspersici]